MHRLGYVAEGWREQDLLAGSLLVLRLIRMPRQTTEFGDPSPLRYRISHEVLVTRLNPVKAAEFTHSKPDIH